MSPLPLVSILEGGCGCGCSGAVVFDCFGRLAHDVKTALLGLVGDALYQGAQRFAIGLYASDIYAVCKQTCPQGFKHFFAI